MPKVRVGILGKRGLAGVSGMRSVAGVEVFAYCDPDESTHPQAADLGISTILPSAEALIDGVDAVVVATPMHLHAEQCIAALERGRHVLSEVTAAVSIKECQALKSAANAGGTYSFAENYCYFKQCLIAKRLAEEGRFGELYFGEGDYVHEVRFLHHDPAGRPTWRKQWQVGARGNTYCTHEVGPLMQWFRAGDPSIRIESVACFGTGPHTDPTAHHDDCTLTLVQLSNGGLLNLQLDMVSNRPHRIGYRLQGTHGALESDDRHRVWLGENRTRGWADPQREWGDLMEFEDALPRSLREELVMAESAEHGGADFLVGRRFGQTAAEGKAPAIGIGAAIEWTVVGLLSQASIAGGGCALPMPAFVYDAPAALERGIRDPTSGAHSVGI